jgi:photosystem II stability/assembly factor-like uncharacterized protein
MTPYSVVGASCTVTPQFHFGICDANNIRAARRVVLGTFGALLLITLPKASAGDEPPLKFTSVGIGGGGAMFSPTCSPHDSNLMFVACDMGGVYRSINGGETWSMIDKRQLRNAKDLPVQFHPTDSKVVYAVGDGRLLASGDAGVTFSPFATNCPWGGDRVAAFLVHPQRPSTILTVAGRALYVTNDAGRTWTESDVAFEGVIKFFATTFASKEVVFVATTNGLFRSDDLGRTWREANHGLPWRKLHGFCGGRDEKLGEVVLYCTIPSQIVDGRFAGGVYRSHDLGESWQAVSGRGLNRDLGRQDHYGFDDIPQYRFVATAENHPKTVYVTTRGTDSRPPHHFTVFRSDDFGDSWRYCFTSGENVGAGWVPVDLNWNFGGPAIGFHVCPSNANFAMFTNLAELYTTRDGGQTWNQAYSTRARTDGVAQRDDAWSSRGLEVTGAWQFAFDPHESHRAYICYTDIGFASSKDRGQTWRYSGRGSPWRNTWYRVAFDPDRPGVIYAACSNHHCIPHYMELDPARQAQRNRQGGGVCISDDFGKSWRPLANGLPSASATSIAIDPRSDLTSRTLYVTMFGHGVYKSTDSGNTWQKASEGLGSAQNMHVYSVKLHSDGTLFCSVTGRRERKEFSDGGGLYRSSDDGATWNRISPALKWAGDFDSDPTDSGTIYLTASTAPGFAEGGLYRTIDGGHSWTRLIREEDLPRELHRFIHAFFVTVHPKKRGTVYFSAYTHGLYLSEDSGSTWREVNGIPFTGVLNVTCDPRDDGIIWVTTHGGGVWKGPAAGVSP